MDAALKTCFLIKAYRQIFRQKSSFKLHSNATEWETGATAMGQGKTTVTPMHMAMITSAIANGGVLMEPYLVDEVENADGGAVSMHNPKSAGELMTTAEAAKLESLCRRS